MLHIIGDIDLTEGYFDKGLGIGNSLVDKKEDPFEYLSRRDDDLWIGNFECVCSDVQATGSPFIINPCHLEHIRHFDCYGIANNHVMQFGDEAYREMEAYFCRKGIKYAGSLKHRSVVFEHQGKRVGFMAFSQRPDTFSESPLYWHLPEYIELEEELNRLHDCDYRIVFVHWGYEFINYPNIDQKNLGRWLVDVGADLVVGTHPHVAQGYEVYKSKHIFYSLGNAVFDMPWLPTKYGLMVTVDLTAEPVVKSSYLHIGENFFPHVVDTVPQEFSIEYLNSLLDITEENENYFSTVNRRYLEYRKANRRNILKNLFKMSHAARMEIVRDFIRRRMK